MGQRASSAAGFTLIEIVIVVVLIGTITAMAIPIMQNFNGAIALGNAQRTIASELQQARMKSVTSNRVLRIHFNCPALNRFRTVELIGTSSIPAPQDTAADRCDPAVYPFPAPDTNPVTFPNQDGPVRTFDSTVTLGAVQSIEFRPTGMVYSVDAGGTATVPLAGNGLVLTVTKGSNSKTITVNALGRIHAQ